MATSITCDYCGEPIEAHTGSFHASFRGRVEVLAYGTGSTGSRTVGQYHNTDERPRWDEIVDRISMIHDVSADLKTQPTPRRAVVQERDPKWIARGERQATWRRMSTQERSAMLLHALTAMH